MSYSERPVLFPCQGETLVGILSLAADTQPSSDTGVVVIVGGPQYRVGSHRQFLLLARHLAAAGIPVLRFDVRGMGDSTGALHTFENITPDVAAAIDTLQQQAPQVRRVVLWGLCDGASAALLYCHEQQDPRVSGLSLFNPWVRSQASLARAHVKHYYADRLRQKDFWLKLVSGKVAGAALMGLIQNLRDMGSSNANAGSDDALPFQHRMAKAWQNFDGPVMLGLSGDDYTAKEFLEYTSAEQAWSGLLGHSQIQRLDLPNADHTFSNASAKAEVQAGTLGWVRQQVAR